MKAWVAEAGWLGMALAAGGIGGSLLGQAEIGIGAAAGCWLWWRVRDLVRFDRWLEHSIGRPPPMRGIPEAMAHRLWRLRQASRNRTHRLTGTLRELQQATNALPDAVVLIDGDGRIAWFNKAATDLLRLDRTAAGHSLASRLPAAELIPILREPHREGTLELQAPKDQRSTLEVRLVSLDASRRLLLARDVSQIARLRTMRQDFIANVSHELRTPLTVIIGYLEALEDDADAELLQATLKRLQRPARRMQSLVEDLLLLSRLDSTNPDAAAMQDPVNVPSLLQRVVAEAQSISPDRHRVILRADSSLRLYGVENELHSAFTNLVVNAIRYSPDGGPIEIDWQPEGDQVRFAVTDHGLGIAPEHLPRLTERFYRVDVGRSRDSGGTGLGLAIVKHVLRRHNAQLDVTSTLGQGSTFSCLFPAHRLFRAPEEETAARTDH